MKKEISWVPIIIVAMVLGFVMLERQCSKFFESNDLNDKLTETKKAQKQLLDDYNNSNKAILRQIHETNNEFIEKVKEIIKLEEIAKKEELAKKQQDDDNYNASSADVYKNEPRKVEIYFGEKLVSTLMSSKSLTIDRDCKELAISTVDHLSIKNFFCPGGYRIVLHSRLK